LVTIESDAARLRAAAEAKPMKLPVNRRVDESHHVVTEDGSFGLVHDPGLPSQPDLRRAL